MANKNLESHLEEIETAVRDGDLEVIENYERGQADKIYFGFKNREREKEELQAKYNSLKMAADKERVNADRIYEDREMKIAMLINHLGYTRLNGRGGRKVPISDAGSAQIGHVFKDIYYRAKI